MAEYGKFLSVFSFIIVEIRTLMSYLFNNLFHILWKFFLLGMKRIFQEKF